MGSAIICSPVGYFLSNSTPQVEKCPTCKKNHSVTRINDDANVFRCDRCNHAFAVYLIQNPVTKKTTKESVVIIERAVA